MAPNIVIKVLYYRDAGECNIFGINFHELVLSRKQTTAAGAELNLLQHSALTYFDRPEDILCHSQLVIVDNKRAYCIELRICA